MNAKKIIAIITTACFLFSFVFAPSAQALGIGGDGNLKTVLSANAFIPPAAGKVSSAKSFGSETVVINIQDLHCHPEVQRNISRILSSLDGRFALDEVYVEGGYGDVDTSRLLVADETLRKKLVESLVEQGKLTGAEYYSITANRPHLLKGIEDKELHQANLARLGKLLDHKSRYEREITALSRDLAFMQAKYMGVENRRFNQLVAGYRSGVVDTDRYYTALEHYVKRINGQPDRFKAPHTIRLEDYPNLALYRELSRLGKDINYRLVANEIKAFMGLLKERLPYRVYNELQEQTGGFSRLDELYVYLAAIARDPSLETGRRYPDLARFFDYTEKSQQLNPRLMIDEERTLVEEIRLGLSRDVAELEVSFLDDFFGYFQGYLLTRLSADDYDYFVQNFDKFQKLWAAYAMRNRLPALAGDLPLLEEYYKVNCERNTCFLRNMAAIANAVPGQNESLTGKAAVADIAGMPDRRAKLVVVVTGGFHTPGIEKLLEERKISYLTVMPAVTKGTTFSDAAYSTFACQQALILSNQLALGLATQFPDRAVFDLLLKTAAQDLKGTAFTEENVSTLVSRIGEATGVQGTRLVFDAKKGEAIIVLTDGNTIVLNKDADGGITLSAGERATVSPREASAAALARTGDVLAASGRLANIVEMVPAGYPALKNLFSFAVRHGLVPGDGLIYRIASDPKLQEKVDGIPVELVAGFPESVQEMMAEHVRREGALDAAAKRSAALRVLLAVDLARNLVLAAAPQKLSNEDELIRLASSSDKARSDLDADVVIICGNDDLRTLEEAVALYGDGKARSIMATGGVGRLTLPLLRTVFNRGIRTIELVPGAAEKTLTLDRETLAQWETAMNNDAVAVMAVLRARGISEALITKALLLDMARERGVTLPPEAILAETESTNTPENFTKARPLLRRMRDDLGRAVRVAYIQKPLQQLRTKATYNAAFANGIDSPGDIEGISYTFDVDRGNAALDPRTGKAVDPVQPAIGEFWRIILYSAVGDVTLDPVRGLKAVSEEDWAKVVAVMQAFPDKDGLRKALLQLADAPGVKPRLGGREALERALEGKGQLTGGVKAIIAWVYGEKSATGGQVRAAQAGERIEDLLAYPLEGDVTRFVAWLDKILFQTDRVLGEQELYAEAEKLGISRIAAEGLAGRAKVMAALSLTFVNSLPKDDAYDVFLLRDSFALYAAARLTGRNARAMLFSKAVFDGLLRSRASYGVLPFLFSDLKKMTGAGAKDRLSQAQLAEFRRLLQETLNDELTPGGQEHSIPGMKEKMRASVPALLAYLDHLEMPGYETRGVRFIDTKKTGTLVMFLETILKLPLRELGLADKDFKGPFDSRLVFSDLSEYLGYPGATFKDAERLEISAYPVEFHSGVSRIDPLTGVPTVEEIPRDKATFLFLAMALRNELLRRTGAAGDAARTDLQASLEEGIARLNGITAKDPKAVTPDDKAFIITLSKRFSFVPEKAAEYTNAELQKHAVSLRILLAAGQRAARDTKEVPPVVLSAFDEIGTDYFAHEFSHLTLDLVTASDFVAVPSAHIEDNYAWRRLMIWEGLHDLDPRMKVALMDLLIEYCKDNQRIRKEVKSRLEQEKDAVGPFMDVIESMMTGSDIDCSMALHTVQTFKTAEAGGLQGLKPVDIAESLRATLEPYSANKKTLAFSFNLADGLPAVAANPVKLAYIWVNLYTNSRDAVIKARRTPGKFEVTADEVRKNGASFVRITFNDTAGGVPARLLKNDQLFEKGVTGTKGHTGLGLYLVRETVRELGGTISVESREGDGTTFTILLPVARKPAAVSLGTVGSSLKDALSRFFTWIKQALSDEAPAPAPARPSYTGLSYGVSPASIAGPKVEFIKDNRILERLGSQVPLSFSQDLAGAEVLVIGPGRESKEVREFIERYPGIKTIHVVDVDDSILEEVRSGLEETGTAGPQVRLYQADARDLPVELDGRIDLVFAGAVFDKSYFTPAQQKEAARSIDRALKNNGIFLSANFHLSPQAFEGTGMQGVLLESVMFQASVKTAGPTTEPGQAPRAAAGLIGEAVIRECGAAGLVPVDLASGPDETNKAEIVRALGSGNVVALTLSDNTLTYFDIYRIFSSLSRSLAEKYGPEMGGLDVDFSAKEILKNAFVHGNLLDRTQPIYLRVDAHTQSISVCNVVREGRASSEELQKANDAYLFNQGAAVGIMKRGRKGGTYDDRRVDVPGLPGTQLFIARTVSLSSRNPGAPLTLASSYAISRAIFRFFGWKPAAGLSDEELAAFEARQDRIAELTLVPFVLVWDIVAHTFRLFIGKGGLNKSRGGGAAVIWAATAAAALTAGLSFNAGIFGIVASAYLANAATHALYNLFFGSATRANSPLTSGPGGLNEASDRDLVDAILAGAKLKDDPALRRVVEELVRLKIFDRESAGDGAQFLRDAELDAKRANVLALGALLEAGAVTPENFPSLRTLLMLIQFDRKYVNCREEAFRALEAFAKAGVVTAGNLDTVRELFLPGNYSTINNNRDYSHPTRYYYFPALKTLAERGGVTPDTLEMATTLFTRQLGTPDGGGFDAAAETTMKLAESGVLTRDNLFLLLTVYYIAGFAGNKRDYPAIDANNPPKTIESVLVSLVGTRDNPRQQPASVEAAWDVYTAAVRAVTPERRQQLIRFFDNRMAQTLLTKQIDVKDEAARKALRTVRLELAIETGPMAHVVLELFPAFAGSFYSSANADEFKEYAGTVGYILTQVQKRQPQASAFDMPDEDDKGTIARHLMTHFYDPHRLRAVFDVYFNSGDDELHKHIDEYDLKFARKNRASFYAAMSDAYRQVHRQQERKLDYNFLVPFLLNFMNDDGTLAPEAEPFFKLFTSKKLHQRRVLKVGMRLKADLLDENVSPESIALFRKLVSLLEKRWNLAAAKSREMDESIGAADGTRQYRSFSMARELIDLVDLATELSVTGSPAENEETPAKDYAREWRPRILQRLDEALAAGAGAFAAADGGLRNAVEQFRYFYKKNKLGVLYDLFAGSVPETPETKNLNIRQLIGYAVDLPVNQDRKTLFDSLVEFIRSNQNRPEVVRAAHAALMAEAKGTFKEWRYSSPDYQGQLAEYVLKAKDAGKARERVKAVSDAWERNRYFSVQGNDGKTYYLGFTDDFATLLNLGNPNEFNSCQATYKPSYNRGLAGYLSNGWNKALVVFGENGQLLSRRIVRLRLDGDGQFMLLREGTYGIYSLDRDLERLLALVAAEMDVRYQPDFGSNAAAVSFRLRPGNAPWDYSDTYGRQFDQEVGLILTRPGDTRVASLTVPLTRSDNREMGPSYEEVDESYFRLVADHVRGTDTRGVLQEDFVSSVPRADFVRVGGMLYYRGVPVHILPGDADLAAVYRPIAGEAHSPYGQLYRNVQTGQLFRQDLPFTVLNAGPDAVYSNALALPSSYAAARAVFRFFGWKPAAGLEGDALAAFEARQNRVAEYTLVPFVLVWDIVAHTFQLLIGKGGLNKFRGGGAAAVWTATVAAALTAGLILHAGAGWIVLAAYLANAGAHALYNYFFGSATKMNSSLSIGIPGGGIAPSYWATGSAVEHMAGYGILDRLSSQAPLSFAKDLSGAEVLIVGPGKGSAEIEKFLELYPGIKTIHVVDISDDVLEWVRSELEEKGLSARVQCYEADARYLPGELAGKIDLVYAGQVFDDTYFTPSHREEIAQSIGRVLKQDGALITATYHLDEEALQGTGLRTVPLQSSDFHAQVKTAASRSEQTVAERMTQLAAGMSTNNPDRKSAYEAVFRLIETELLELDKAARIKVLNEVLDNARLTRKDDTFYSFRMFLGQISVSAMFDVQSRLTDIELSRDTMYRTVIRGMPLSEMKSLVESGEIIKIPEYGTFAIPGDVSRGYTGETAGEGFVDDREVLVAVQAPRWLMVPADYDFGLEYYGESREEIFERHRTFLETHLAQAQAVVAANKAAFEERFGRYQADLQQSRGKRLLGKTDQAAFFRARENKVYKDAERDVRTFFGRLKRWASRDTVLATLDGKYVDWQTTYELNQERFAGEPDRWALDIEPLLAAGRKSQPSMMRTRSGLGASAGEGASALTLASSYVTARAIFRFFGWKPAAGSSDDALEAFAARQDRVAEYTIVPFVLVWDIVAHTFQLMIGKGGLNKYRGGGAAAIWTATAAAALTAGLALHAGAGWVVLAAYLANAATHALYNLFFGSTTPAGSPLTIDWGDAFGQLGLSSLGILQMPGPNVSPVSEGQVHAAEIDDLLKDVMPLTRQYQPSFASDLAGADIMIIGPGKSIAEVREFITACPNIKRFHIVDRDQETLDILKDKLAREGTIKGLPVEILYHQCNVVDGLPAELTETVDLVCACKVFDDMFFYDLASNRRIADGIHRVLKPGGMFFSSMYHLPDSSFAGWNGMNKLSLPKKTTFINTDWIEARMKGASSGTGKTPAGQSGEGIVPSNTLSRPFVPAPPALSRDRVLPADPYARYVEYIGKEYEQCLTMRKYRYGNDEPLSFAKNLAGAEVLVIGAGRGSDEIERFIKLYPGIKTLHIADSNDAALEAVRAALGQGMAGLQLQYHQSGVRDLPAELTGKIDLVYACRAFDKSRFTLPQEEEALRSVNRVLKGNGALVAVVDDLKEDAFAGTDLKECVSIMTFVNSDLGGIRFQIAVKHSDSSARSIRETEETTVLTLPSSYAVARKIFAFFGWKPAKGLSGKALEAFVARQDRVAEFTLVPFVLVWDIVAHTFQLMIGKGGLNKYRGGGAAAVWTATAAAALTTGLALHAGAGWVVLAAYLANAAIHALYNLFFGSTTPASSPLSTDAFDPFHPPLSQGIAPLVTPFAKYVDRIEGYHEVITSGRTLSFTKDLAGAEVLIVGPGGGTAEIEKFLELYPGIKTLHVADINAASLEEVRAELERKGLAGPQLQFYHADVRDLPAELTGRIDLAYASYLFDTDYFTPEQAKAGVQSIGRALKGNGALITVAFHPETGAYAGTGLELFPRQFSELQAAIKAPAPSARTKSAKARMSAAAERMKAAALRMDSFAGDRKDAYEEMFELIETEVLGLDKNNQLKLLNEVWAYVGSHSDGDAPRILWQFLRAISDTVQFTRSGRIADIALSPDTLYRTVVRGMPLAELKDILETGEDVKVAEYATFANPGEIEAYTKPNAGEGFAVKREVLISVKAPRWLMVPAYNDFGLRNLGENRKEILQRHKPVMDKLLAEARAVVDANRAAFEERLRQYRAELQQTRGRGRMTDEEEVRFYRIRENKVYMDAKNDVATLSSRSKRWSDKNFSLATIDARHIDWEKTYELNRKRFIDEPERWALDIEPLLTAARTSQPSRSRGALRTGDIAGKGAEQAARDEGLIDRAVAAECGAAGVVHVDVTDNPSESFTPEAPQFETIFKALKDGNVVALTLSGNKRAYQNVFSFFVNLAYYLRTQFDPDGKTYIYFLLKEMLKNAFAHGNLLDQTRPIYLQLDFGKKIARVCNVVQKNADLSPEDLAEAAGASLFGAQQGVANMANAGGYSSHIAAVQGQPETRIFVAQVGIEPHNLRTRTLSLPSSYALSRAIFRFFGWTPAKGLSDDELEAFVARQNRVAEYTLVPFVLVWDIVVHTFLLMIGKGGLNKYRGGGAAATWTATAATALTAGLALHAGAGWIVLAAYLANAATHALYNLFYGSATKADSPLSFKDEDETPGTVDWLRMPFDQMMQTMMGRISGPAMTASGPNASPVSLGQVHASEIDDMFKDVMPLTRQHRPSFAPDLAGADVMIVGPGRSIAEIREFITACPNIKRFHIVDRDQETLDILKDKLAREGTIKGLPVEIRYYRGNVVDGLPEDLAGQVDIVCACKVFDSAMFFDPASNRRIAGAISRVLKPGGMYFSSMYHLPDDSFSGQDGMTKLSLPEHKSLNGTDWLEARMKEALPEAGTPVDETVVREFGAAGIVRVSIDGHPSDKFTPDTPQFAAVCQALKDGNVVALSLGDDGRSYQGIESLIAGLAGYLHDQFKPVMKQLDVNFLVKEMLKNAFVHGNNLNRAPPIYLHMDANKQVIRVCNIEWKGAQPHFLEWQAAKQAGLHGEGWGVATMKEMSDYADYYLPVNGQPGTRVFVAQAGVKFPESGSRALARQSAYDRSRDAVVERMKSAVLRMDSSARDRKTAYEEIFRLIETEVLGMDKEDQLALLNDVFEYAKNNRSGDASYNFWTFLRDIGWAVQRNESGRIVDIILSPDTLYRRVVRGMALEELKYVIETGEDVKVAEYGTFANPGVDSRGYTGTVASEGFAGSLNREVLISVKAPRWLMVRADNDFGLGYFGEDNQDILRRHRPVIERHLEEARAIVAGNKAAYEERLGRYEAELRRTRGERAMNAEEKARFFQARENKVYEDARRDVETLSARLTRWPDKFVPLSTLDAGYIDWNATYEMNKERFSGEPERWALDIEPLLAAARKTPPSRARIVENAGKGEALTLASSYALSRAIFRFFGWKPAKGLDDDALEAFVARQNRVAELTLVPFVLVWDIVAHTFQLLMGKGGLNKYRGGGAAAIWTATAAAALTAGLALHAGTGWVVLAAYLANAVTHALYNLFFGSTTKAGSPLSGDVFDPAHPPFSQGVVPLGGPYARYVESIDEYYDLIAPRQTLSFTKDLSGAEVLIVGPGKGTAEIEKFLELYPGIKTLHVVDVNAANVEWVRAELERKGLASPRLQFYTADVRDLPAGLNGRIDLVYASRIFDGDYFTPEQAKEGVLSVDRVLKGNGALITVTYHPDTRAFDGTDLDLFPLTYGAQRTTFKAVIKTARPAKPAVPQDAEAGIRAQLQAQYGLEEGIRLQELTGGMGAVKPLLVTAQKGKYVFKPMGTDAGTARYVISLRERLREKGLPVPSTVKRLNVSDGSDPYSVRIGDQYFILEQFMEQGEMVEKRNAGPRHYRALGRLAAGIQNALEGFVPEGTRRFPPRESIVSGLRAEAVKKRDLLIRAGLTSPADRIFLGNYDFIMAQFDAFEQNYSGEIRARLRPSHIHNDLHFGNVKFNPQGEITAVFDMNMAQEGPRTNEFNNLMLNGVGGMPYGNNGYAAFESMLAGYQETAREKLSPEEIRAAIEVLRSRFLEYMVKFFASDSSIWSVSKYPEQLSNARETLDAFKRFAADMDRNGDSLVRLISEQGNRPRAILPENRAQVGRWAMEGRSPLSIAVRVALREFIPSVFTPRAFVLGHTDEAGRQGARGVVLGTWLGAGIGMALGAAALFAGAPLALLAAGFIAGLTAGNAATHIYIDWHYVKASGLAEAVKEFGAAAVDENGQVRTNIYVMDSMPDDPAGWGLRNTGLNVDGKPVWASTKLGALVLFAETKDAERALRELSAAVAGKGQVGGNRRLVVRLKDFLSALQVKTGNAGFAPSVTIDHAAPGRVPGYNADGTMIVGADFFRNGSGAFEKQVISSRLGELETIRNAEAVAVAQNIGFRLDDVTTIGQFEKRLEDFNRVGNGQMVVRVSVFEGISDRKLEQLAILARMNGVRIFVEAAEGIALNRFEKLGFAGYATVQGRAVTLVSFATNNGIPGETIAGYRTAPELRDMMRRSKAQFKLFNLSEVAGLLNGGERSIIERVDVLEVFKTNMLGLFDGGALNAEYVARVARAWDREKLPVLPDNAENLVRTAADDGNSAGDVLAALGTAHVPQTVVTYLAKLANDAGGDQAKGRQLQKVFLRTLVERMLAKARLDAERKFDGLADEDLERLLGQKLFTRALTADTRVRDLLVDPKAFVNRVKREGLSAEDTYAQLSWTVRGLQNDVRPEAVKTIIELIAQLGEARIAKQQQKAPALFNEKSMQALLQAA